MQDVVDDGCAVLRFRLAVIALMLIAPGCQMEHKADLATAIGPDDEGCLVEDGQIVEVTASESRSSIAADPSSKRDPVDQMIYETIQSLVHVEPRALVSQRRQVSNQLGETK